MDVAAAVTGRRSVRQFLDKPVSREMIERLLKIASRSPSGGNIQPWKIFVVAGEPLVALKAMMPDRIAANPRGEDPQYDVYPRETPAEHEAYRFRVGEMMYERLGIPREDKLGRARWFAQNFAFFDAPVGLFCYVDRRMGPPQWSDLGMFLQTLMLLLHAEGLDSCPQEAWSWYYRTVGEILNPPPELMMFCGMAIGYRDPDAIVNGLVTERAPVSDFTTFVS